MFLDDKLLSDRSWATRSAPTIVAITPSSSRAHACHYSRKAAVVSGLEDPQQDLHPAQGPQDLIDIRALMMAEGLEE
jgi:hypothetical protein